MRAASLSLRVGCFDDVDANRLAKSESREGEGDWAEGLTEGGAEIKEAKGYLSEN